jgi:hypothetical protein
VPYLPYVPYVLKLNYWYRGLTEMRSVVLTAGSFSLLTPICHLLRIETATCCL